jgi:putative aldouronate transport system substrate-binding protein
MGFKKQSVIIAALILVLLIPVSSIWAGAQKEDGAAGAAVQKAPGPFGKYEPGITITTVSQPNTVGPKRFAEGDSDTNNPWIRAYRDILGINAELKWVSDELETKTNLMISSGDIPDFFYVNKIQFQQVVEAGLAQDIKAAYTEYASDNTRLVLEEEAGPTPMSAATRNGKLLALPWTLYKESTPILWVRYDWLETLGMELPATMQELMAVSEAFTKNDPDRNGQNDTYGLMAMGGRASDFYFYLKGFFNGFHAYPQAWVTGDDGKLAYGSIQPEMKQAVMTLREMYLDGQLDKEFAVINADKAREQLAAGKSGIHYGEFHSVHQAVRDNDPDAQFRSIPIVSVDQNPAKAQLGDLIYGYWVVRDGYEYPEAVVKMMNLWMDYFYFTKEQEIYDTYSSGGMWLSSLIKAYRGYKNLSNAEEVTAVIKGQKSLDDINPEQKGVYERVTSFLDDGVTAQWRYTKIFGPYPEPSMFVVRHYRDNGYMQEDSFYGPPTDTMTKKWSTLEDKILETYVKIITGEPVELFDEMVATWYKLGGQEITDEVNEWYSRQ